MTTSGRFVRFVAGVLLLVVAGVAASPEATAQSIEPRQYVNTPVGVNFAVAAYAYTDGGIAFDPALPARNPQLTTDSLVLGYARSLDLWGLSGKIDAAVPYTWLDGSVNYAGERLERTVDGFGDPVVRLSVNLYGAPALQAADFASYRQDFIVGAALQVSVPVGQYDDTRLVNLGSNRWWIKPSLGVSKALDPWILEAGAAVTIFTDNDDYYGGHERSQDPLYSLEWHVIRSFRRGIWASLDGNFYTGGSSSVDGVAKHDLQRNWRVGGTLALPVNRRNSIKFYASDGVSARTGNNYSLVGIAWQYRWGAGF